MARGVAVEVPAKPAKPKVDPELRAQASQVVREVLAKLEQEIAQGHGKASAGAAMALRNALKEHGKLIDDKLENQAHAALAAAGELEGWQRWRADQLRQELVAKAEGLFEHLVPAEGQEPQPPKPRYGGRKMQEQLRALRDQWKQTDQGGVPNHALWKRFDDACNEAYKVVEAWLDKVKAEAAEHKAQRLALIEEVKAWAGENATAPRRGLEGFQPHPAPVRSALARCRAPERKGIRRIAAAVEGGHSGSRRAARGDAKAEPGASPRDDRRSAGRWAPSRSCASTPSRRCSSAGRPRPRPCRWTASTSKSSGMRSASRSTKRSTARPRSARRPRLP